MRRAEVLEIHADNERFLKELRDRREQLDPKQAKELEEMEQSLVELRRRHQVERKDLNEWIERVELRVAKGP